MSLLTWNIFFDKLKCHHTYKLLTIKALFLKQDLIIGQLGSLKLMNFLYNCSMYLFWPFFFNYNFVLARMCIYSCTQGLTETLGSIVIFDENQVVSDMSKYEFLCPIYIKIIKFLVIWHHFDCFYVKKWSENPSKSTENGPNTLVVYVFRWQKN